MQLKIYTDFEKNLLPNDLVNEMNLYHTVTVSVLSPLQANCKEKAIFFSRLNVWYMFRFMSRPFIAKVIFKGVANLTENWSNTDNIHSKCFTKMKSSL